MFCLYCASAPIVSYTISVQFSDEKIWYIPKNELYVCENVIGSPASRSPRNNCKAMRAPRKFIKNKKITMLSKPLKLPNTVTNSGFILGNARMTLYHLIN